MFLFALMFLLLSLQPVAIAAATKVTVQTNHPTYPVGLNTIVVSGNVTPPPNETNTWIAISILSPSGSMVDANQFEVTPKTGVFNGTFVTGGPTYTGPGDYTIKAEYDDINATAGFQYGGSLANQTSTSTSTAHSTSTIVTTTSLTSTPSITSQTSTTTSAMSTTSSNSTTSSVETSVSTSHSTTSSSSSAALEIEPIALVMTIAAVALVFALLVRIRRPSSS